MAKRKKADVFPVDAPKKGKTVETLTHEADKRRNIPTAEMQSVMKQEQQGPIRVEYDRRNRDLDPQLVWRGKDEQDWSDLVVNAPPLYIQEKVHPKVLIDDLLRQTEKGERTGREYQHDLFHVFNGVPEGADRTDFYHHDQNWSNRMILGDSLQVMASLAEREGLRGKVQCIYFDPPYGIKFNSNFQWSTTSRDVKDGKADHITREPEQVKAFRDTWRDGIHSYLTYLRDRLTVARDLLTESGSIFVQIGDENVHRVREVLDEVFGDDNFAAFITFRKKMMPLGSDVAEGVSDYLLWYAKSRNSIKSRPLFYLKDTDEGSVWSHALLEDGRRVPLSNAESQSESASPYQSISLLPAQYRKNQDFVFDFEGKKWPPPKSNCWKTDLEGMSRLRLANRLHPSGSTLRYILKHADYPVGRITNLWSDASGATQQTYVVQTNTDVVKRCLLMTTDPGDLVLDPTCGSGTIAYVAEQWGRRWITIDTSRVALALARARIMGARYPYYLLADSREGQKKEAELTATVPSTKPTHGNVRLGFVYERVPHVTLKSIANNAEIDVIYDKWQAKMEPLREDLNKALKRKWEEWETPREADTGWSADAKKAHADWWTARIARHKEIDASIATKAECEYLYDKPYEDKKKVRVAGPFTVESLSPHRVLGVDENDNLIDPAKQTRAATESDRSFEQVILENLKTAGVQQAHKSDKIEFTSLVPWPGSLVCAEGHYEEGGKDRRAAIFIGPEFGTVTRPDLVAAAREAADAGFDALISCAFNYEAHATEFTKLGRIPVLKARMNADLHMAEDLKNTGKGNLFVIFGEPDIELMRDGDDLQVKINGVDVFHPNTGEVRSDGAEGIACWFIDTDYNEESFFVRHAYFLGANDPYGALKTTLKAEINPEAWESLNSDTSRSFPKPKSGRIAVKVINHLGDEVMKVFKV
jgi:adenine-specific DNA-methyltransferase